MELRNFSGTDCGITRLGGDFNPRSIFERQFRVGAGNLLPVGITDHTAEQIAVKVCAGLDFHVCRKSAREFRAAHARPVEAVVSA